MMESEVSPIIFPMDPVSGGFLLRIISVSVSVIRRSEDVIAMLSLR